MLATKAVAFTVMVSFAPAVETLLCVAQSSEQGGGKTIFVKVNRRKNRAIPRRRPSLNKGPLCKARLIAVLRDLVF